MSEPSVGDAGARNPPMRAYSGEPRRHSQSLRFTDVAATRTSTCPAAGTGTGTCSMRNTSGGPYRSWTAALMIRAPPLIYDRGVSRARTDSMESASAGDLSVRYRRTRAKRRATPPG